jgi:hypothetical protein
LRKRLLAVGDSTEIEIIYSSGSHHGGFVKSPRLYTSDPSVSQTMLRLKGEILEQNDPLLNTVINVDPFGLNIIAGDEKDEYTVRLKNVTDEKLELKLVSYDPEFLKIDLPKDIKPGDTKNAVVKLINSEAHRESGFDKSFSFEASDSAKTRYTIPVSYHKETSHASTQPSATWEGQTKLEPSGLETKTGNTVHIIDAGNKGERANGE